MSKEAKGIVKSNLKTVHHKLSHNNRVVILASEISDIFDATINSDKPVNALDIGCGDMRLTELIDENTQTAIDWRCIDILILQMMERQNGISIKNLMERKFLLKMIPLILQCSVMSYITTSKI